jgi:hypothetical protein
MAEVFGAFTRALRGADLEKYEEYFCAGILAGSRGRGLCPICRSAQPALYELKGTRSDRSHSNYNGAQVTGVRLWAASCQMGSKTEALSWSSSSSPCPALLYKAGNRADCEGPVPVLAVQDVCPHRPFLLPHPPTHPPTAMARLPSTSAVLFVGFALPCFSIYTPAAALLSMGAF